MAERRSASYFITRGECPVRKIVGEAFLNEMVLLQGLEGVLKDGGVRTSANGFQQLLQTGSLFPSNPQQV